MKGGGGMRAIVHGWLGWLPSKLLGGVGWACSILAAIAPASLRVWVNWIMSPEQIRIWGLIGFAIFSLYWIFWFLTKPEAAVSSETSDKKPPRFEIGDLGEGHFEGNEDASGRQFLNARSVGKLTALKNKFRDEA